MNLLWWLVLIRLVGLLVWSPFEDGFVNRTGHPFLRRHDTFSPRFEEVVNNAPGQELVSMAY